MLYFHGSPSLTPSCTGIEPWLWNLVLWLCGMDIDFSSQVMAVDFLPSIVDLVIVRKSFVLPVSIENGHHSVTITNSSIENCSCLKTGENMTIFDAMIPPLSYIMTSTTTKKSFYHEKGKKLNFISTRELFQVEALQEVLYYLLSCGIIFCTCLIPPYKVWIDCFGNPTSIWMAVQIKCRRSRRSLILICLHWVMSKLSDWRTIWKYFTKIML